jgi:hypothetical protein
MTDSAIVAVVLVVGGGAYLAVFLWVTAVRVREIGPPTAPHGVDEERNV